MLVAIVVVVVTLVHFFFFHLPLFTLFYVIIVLLFLDFFLCVSIFLMLQACTEFVEHLFVCLLLVVVVDSSSLRFLSVLSFFLYLSLSSGTDCGKLFFFFLFVKLSS